MTFLPTLNAFGSYQLYDKEIFQFGANGYLFGAELKWDILEGNKALWENSKDTSDLREIKTRI